MLRFAAATAAISMRDRFSWNLFLMRIAGVQVRLHVFFLVFAVFAIHYSIQQDKGLLSYGLASLAILLVSVFCHEMAHCITARRFGGYPEQVVLWPLGGLVPAATRNDPRAELVTSLAGPLVNLVVCLATAPVLISLGAFGVRSLNPLAPPPPLEAFTWQGCVALVFWLNWILVIFNLLPAFPMDGGRALRALLRPAFGHTTSVLQVALIAKVTAVLLVVFGVLVYREYAFAALPLALLGIFLFFSAKQESERLRHSEPMEDSVFGYDFSQGYTSLERTVEAAPVPQRVGLVRHWLKRRREAKRIRQIRAERDEERRVDDILARLHEQGMSGLSADDRAILHRVSARYRERQGR